MGCLVRRRKSVKTVGLQSDCVNVVQHYPCERTLCRPSLPVSATADSRTDSVTSSLEGLGGTRLGADFGPAHIYQGVRPSYSSCEQKRKSRSAQEESRPPGRRIARWPLQTLVSRRPQASKARTDDCKCRTEAASQGRKRQGFSSSTFTAHWSRSGLAA